MSAATSPPRVVLLGVAGRGKSTLGQALAGHLGVDFVEADDLHGAANRARMAQGLPLDDAAREPWLAAVHTVLTGLVAAGRGFVLACSLLKHDHRERLQRGLPPLRLVHLAVPPDVLRQRLTARRGHFFPVTLLDDQLAAWQPLEHGHTIAADGPPAELVARLAAMLQPPPAGFTSA
ncbi:MAG: AAA family ATPase [Planctomycetes bacterium]|nr:AAA family ATPase [Planctomycetota bacterium]